MKKFIYCALTSLLLATSGAEFSPAPQQQRSISIGKTPVIEMAKAGKIGFEIVAGNTPTTKFAAQEVADTLSKVFNTKIPVLSTPSGRVPAIVIGDAAFAAKCGIDVQTLDRDGFVIKTVDKNIIIIGRDDPTKAPLKEVRNYGLMAERGTLNGVYDFLERFAGVRFYFPGDAGTVIPRQNDWTLPEINISDRPDYLQRRIYLGESIAFPSESPANIRELNHLRLRLETMAIPNCHGLAFLGLIQRFAQSHPEYFALQDNGLRHFDTTAARSSSRNGHICFSSKIKDVIIDDAEAFLTGQPASSRNIIMPNGKSYWSNSRFPAGMPFFNIMPNDSCYRCRCPECWSHFSKGPQETSNYIWKFFTDIAREGQKRKLPGYFTTMAYDEYKLIPNVDIPKNLLVMLALRGPWNAHNTDATKYDLELLKGWNDKLKAKTWLWTYPSKWSLDLPGVPNYAPRATGKYYAGYAPWIFGAYMEAESDTFMGGAINFYLFSRVAWDNQSDVDAILDEYNKLMFGPAAAEMAQIGDILETKWLDSVGRSVETPEGPKTQLPSLFDLWNKIWSPEEIAKVDATFERAEKAASADPEALNRVRFMRAELWRPLKNAREQWSKTIDAKSNWYAVMPEGQWSDPYFLIPLGGKPAEVKTSVRMKRDTENFYFSFECEEPLTSAMVAPERQRDDLGMWADSCVEVHLDPAGSGAERYQFMLTAGNGFADMLVKNKYADAKWNSGAESKAVITSDKGYTVEIKIPRRSMPEAIPGKFKANFTRHRVLSGVKVTSLYAWSFFAKNFGDLQNYGTIRFEADPRPQLLKDGSFIAPIRGRFVGTDWFSGKPLKRDDQTFVTAGTSIVLEKGQQLAQYLPELKPETDYVLSFWVKLADKTEFITRFDEGSGHVYMLPKVKISGPLPWTRQEFKFRTRANVGGKSQAYVRFQLQGDDSNAWLNAAELREGK